MTPAILAWAAGLLSLERATYVVIARAPDAFRRLCALRPVGRLGEPIAVVEKLFCGFKVLQLAVFLGWCYLHGDGSLMPRADGLALALGSVGIMAGQVLNLAVFYRLGRVGVFYGDRLGYRIPWCRTFPFSWFAHPQYVGTVLTIWGFFLVMRAPHGDWYLLPALETAYYLVGAALEEPGERRARSRGYGLEGVPR
jgi:phosphatidyl-N-methylethanolamine N-methyltransferase